MITLLNPADRAAIDELHSLGFDFVDAWQSALPELRTLDSFDAVDRFDVVERDGAPDLDRLSRYAVYPWRRTVVRVPDDGLWHRLRTARNRYLITDDEQLTWASTTIAVAGLSVGGSVLAACAMTGARDFRIADPDTLGPTNLNRLAGSVCDLGVAKTTLAHRRIVEADPYARVAVFDGYSPESADEFLCGAGILLEEMDDLAMKVDIRRRARALRVPVVMVTDDGDDVIVDVERYDLDPDYPLFHGRAPGVEQLSVDELRDPARKVSIAGAIVGADVAPRLQMALREVGRSIASWPQLGTAATLAGAVGAVTARKVVCGGGVPSGRSRVRIG